MTARPLAVPVAPLALGYDERKTQANIQHVEYSHLGSYLLVTQENSDVYLAQPALLRRNRRLTGALRLRRKKMGILSVATSYSRRTDSA